MKARYYQPEVVERVRSEREERAQKIAELKEKNTKSGFYFTVDGELHLDVEQLWPEGGPENPTVGDVIDLLSERGDFREYLLELGLLDELTLVITGNGGKQVLQ